MSKNKRTEKKEIDCRYTNEIVCPFCGYEFHDSWDYGITESESVIECVNDECGKEFYVYAHIGRTYISAQKYKNGSE